MKLIKNVKQFLKMKFEMFVWRLYDKCADYLDKYSLVDRVDSDKLQELEEEKWKLYEKLLDKDREIMDLDNTIYHLEQIIDRLEDEES